MGPEESMQIQSNLASTIAMAFDECPSSVAERSYVEDSVARTTRWLARCKTEMARLNSLEDTINKNQLLFGINQVFDFNQRFMPRLLDGICLGYIFKGMRKVSNTYVACAVTGFFSAFLNTLFFMTALVGLFGNTDYVKNLMGGHNIIIGCCLMVGINAVCEMISSTVITGAVGAALFKAHLIPSAQISREKTKA